jgi:hypothetical protein
MWRSAGRTPSERTRNARSLAEFEWDSPSPEAVAAPLEGCRVPSWISGGWVIDLFLGEQTREHADLDLGCFRDELPGFLEPSEG